MKQDRRDFLGSMAAAGFILPAAGSLGPSERSDSEIHAPESAFPLPGVDWDLSWTSKLTGPHRAAFDWFEAEASAGLWRAAVWKQQVVESFKVKPEEVGAVLVIRHRAIPMIMGDEFWMRHKLGKVRKLKNPENGKTAERNPYRQSPNARSPEQDFSIEGFLKNGGIVLACGFAFISMVSLEAGLQGKSVSEVRPEVLQQVIPGITLQPSGFFALLEAQRNGCGVFPAV